MNLQQRIIPLIIASALWHCNSALALGLGELTLKSTLHQPLNAEVKLLKAAGLNQTDIFPGLGTREDFQQAGIDYPSNLTDLRFRAELQNNGTGVVYITSTKPIQEPYLNFLLEVNWPSGRLLREYTVFIDPPAFSQQPTTTAVSPPTRQPHDIFPLPSQQHPYQPTASNSVYRDRQPTTHSQHTAERTDGHYQVKANDHLWGITKQLNIANDLSIQQTMLAIQQLNPDAFINGNINRLKKGAVLKLPDRQMIQAIAFTDALWEVAKQNHAWQLRRERLAQPRAKPSPATDTATAPSPATSAGKLTIVTSNNTDAGDGGKGDTKQDIGTTSKKAEDRHSALPNELAIAREQLDALTRENAELKSRLQDLDEQINTLKKLVTLRDDQLAALQSAKPADLISQSAPHAGPPLESKPSTPPPDFFATLFSSTLFWLTALLMIASGAGYLIYQRRKAQTELADEDPALDIFALDDDQLKQDSPSPTGKQAEPKQAAANPGDAQDDSLVLDEALELDEDLLNELEQDVNQPPPTAMPTTETETTANEQPHTNDDNLDPTAAATDDFDGLDLSDATDSWDDDLLNDLDGDDRTSTISDSATVSDQPDAADKLDWDRNGLDLGSNDNTTPATAIPPAPDAQDTDSIDFDVAGLDLPTNQAQADSQDTDLTVDVNHEDFDLGLDDDDLVAEDDEVATKLNLARAYIDMDDQEGATEILTEVLAQGTDAQKEAAQALLDQL